VFDDVGNLQLDRNFLEKNGTGTGYKRKCKKRSMRKEDKARKKW
jgi:hypothetical protein